MSVRAADLAYVGQDRVIIRNRCCVGYPPGGMGMLALPADAANQAASSSDVTGCKDVVGLGYRGPLQRVGGCLAASCCGNRHGSLSASSAATGATTGKRYDASKKNDDQAEEFHGVDS